MIWDARRNTLMTQHGKDLKKNKSLADKHQIKEWERRLGRPESNENTSEV